ncbi:MAG TPA: hypothetical protein VK327_17645, partial [Candidatus Paceibacterota bacterium]|nr:hypothetical protein [Candidatus Paceibacterota bacterium]
VCCACSGVWKKSRSGDSLVAQASGRFNAICHSTSGFLQNAPVCLNLKRRERRAPIQNENHCYTAKA